MQQKQNEIDEEVLESRFGYSMVEYFNNEMCILRLADVSAVMQDEPVLECIR